jgi:hypothetical protein
MSFSGDDVSYYAEWVVHGYGQPEVAHGLEYYFAPHNGHLQTVGKVIYRLLFAIFGAEYAVFRVVDVAGILAAVGIFYVLASRRVGPILALAPCVLLLFSGYAWEASLWAFDMHTVLSLAFGLGALLALERGDRTDDVLGCALLFLAVFMIELGLAFVVGAAVLILLQPDRRRRIWVVLVPLVAYAVWWLWARQYDQSTIELHNIRLLPAGFLDALAAVMGSITGLNPTGGEIWPETTTITTGGTVLAVLAVIGLIVRVRRGNVPPTLWAFLAVALVYWTMIALGGRPPDSSRYILAGTTMVFLVAADALRGIRLSLTATVAVFVVVAVFLPANLAKFYDGRRTQLIGAQVSRTEFTMLELVRDRVAPDYAAPADQRVIEVGGSFGPAMPAAEYFRAAERYGPLNYPLDEIRGGEELLRNVADATLVGAIGLAPTPSPGPQDKGNCQGYDAPAPGQFDYLPLPKSGVRLIAPGDEAVELKVTRFAPESAGVPIGQLTPGEWALVRPGPDSAPDAWRLLIGGAVRVCPA